MIAILTEANLEVATGHLMESVELASALMEAGKEVVILVNADCPKGLIERITGSYIFYSDEGEVEDILKRISPELLVTDLRKLENDQLLKYRECFRGKIICIDEWGHRRLDADVIINPMIDPYYWEYKTLPSTKLYCGAEYLILPKKLQEYRGKKRGISDEIRRVCVSMGGVDRRGMTLKLAEWLPELLPDALIDIIVGGGFPHLSELQRLVREKDLGNRISVSANVDNIYEHFIRADVAFCAGGNTLHELACLGVPAIVIPSMPHEMGNGRCFEGNGFGICISASESTLQSEVKKSVKKISDYESREKMRVKGKRLQDGRGVDKIYRICKQQGA